MRDEDWEADLARCEPGSLWREQSLWAIAVYRYGRRTDALPASLRKRVRTKLYWLMYRVVETLTGISLPKTALIGPGLRIWHFGGIFVHDKAQIGANCTLRQGVTIGNRHAADDVPIIGDDVEFGAYAQVLGKIRVGNGAKIGALSMVLSDVPSRATAVGIPARIIPGNDAGRASPGIENGMPL